jgi:hypothetical protein
MAKNIQFGNLFESTFEKHKKLLNLNENSEAENEFHSAFNQAISAAKKLPQVTTADANTGTNAQPTQNENAGAFNILDLIAFIFTVPIAIKYLGYLIRGVRISCDKLLGRTKEQGEKHDLAEKFFRAAEKVSDTIEAGIQFSLEKLGIFKKAKITDEKTKKEVVKVIYILLVLCCVFRSFNELHEIWELIKEKQIFASAGNALRTAIDFFESGKDIREKVIAVVGLYN